MAVTYTIQGRLDGLNTFIYANRTNPYKGARCKKKQSKNLQGIHTTMAKEKAHKISSDSGN